MAGLTPARRAALDALMQAQESGRYVRDIFAHGDRLRRLSSRDAAFALRLALGVTATEGCLDDALNAHLAKPGKVSARVRCCLRISAYEALYLDTPADVVVSQGVELVRSCAKSASGLANAVLRRVCENRTQFLGAGDAVDEQRPIVSAARRSGLPVWLARAIIRAHPLESSRILAAQTRPAPTAVHLNARLDGSKPSWLDRAQPASLGLAGAYRVAHVGAVAHAGAFDRADAVASDFSAQLIATAAVAAGSCLEIGAGRGTKTFVMQSQAIRAGLTRTHVALDLYEGKCAANARRIELAEYPRVKTAFGDARDLDAVLGALDREAARRMEFDTVLVDAPCSGTGTMRRHGEIPWRLARTDVTRDLPELQFALLSAAAARVAVGGQLLYATCSIMPEENEGVLERFARSEMGSAFRVEPLSQAPAFCLEPFRHAADVIRGHEDGRGLFHTYPAPDEFDGHFCARMVRRS